MAKKKASKPLVELNVGMKVVVPVRFGEEGEIVKIKGRGEKKRYGVKLASCDLTLWYEAKELVPETSFPSGYKPLHWATPGDFVQ